MRLRWHCTILGGLLLAACGSSTSKGGQPGNPAPQPNPTTPSGDNTASGIVYTPVHDASYQLVRHDSISMQLPGGANQVQLIDRTAYVHLSLTRDTNSYLATIVLDSLQASVGGVPAVPDSVIPARGTRWTANLTPDGKLSALRADRSTTVGDQIGSHLRALFPPLPPGGARAGMEWTDTTEVPIRAEAFDATERSLASFHSTESDDPHAKKALKLEGRATFQRTGKGTQYDQQMEMTASGNRTAVYYLNPDGTLASAHGSDSGDMTITVPAVGQTVPVKQTGTYTITTTRSPAKH
jgi:hypothetical protein